MNRIRLEKPGASLAPIFLWLVLLLIPAIALPAELRGRIWDASTGAAPKNGLLELNCGGSPNPHRLAGKGSYSIRDVPNGTCVLTVVTSRGRASRTITINKPVVQFNCETRTVGNKVFLVPR